MYLFFFPASTERCEAGRKASRSDQVEVCEALGHGYEGEVLSGFSHVRKVTK